MLRRSETGRGQIFTFYSYKGGTGRSMALANVAWLLASNNKRVLIVDWDLEAPGLHRFIHPFLVDTELEDTPGIIDLLQEFEDGAMSPSPEGAEPDHAWYEPITDVGRYRTRLSYSFEENGSIDFIPAGRQDTSYADRVTGFDWRNFYERLGGGIFLEALKRRMRAEYDYVLIDSRTGVSDTSGICTVQMPDVLVVCFMLNRQSIEGAARIAEAVKSSSHAHLYERYEEDARVRIVPIPMRVEDGEKRKMELGLAHAAARFSAVSSEPNLWELWGEAQVPYRQYYAYEEILAAIADRPFDRQSISASLAALTRVITGEPVEARPPPEPQRSLLITRFERDPAEYPQIWTAPVAVPTPPVLGSAP